MKKLKVEDKSDNDMSDKIADSIKCQICMEIIYQPVSLYPCLHNFCGGCFSDWNKRSDDCPSCRTKVKEVKKNHMIFSLAEMYLKQHADAQRPQDELDALDKVNQFKQDRVILSKGGDSDSSSSEEETKTTARAAPTRGTRNIRGARPAPRQRAVQNVCKQCPKAFEGYQCAPGQVHIQCITCKQFMPDRNAQQKCAICTRVYCNAYWRASKCRVGIATVDSYVPTAFTIIKNSALNENKFEQNVVMDYLRKKKLQMQVVAREMIDAMEINQWNITLSIS